MAELKPFLFKTSDKVLWRSEWETWLRSFNIYAEAEEINSTIKKRNKLLHLGGPQLQTVVYSLPEALIQYDEELKNDVFKLLVDKLNEYFSPPRNSAFERYLYRAMTPSEFGSTEEEIREICLKDKLIDAWAPRDLTNVEPKTNDPRLDFRILILKRRWFGGGQVNSVEEDGSDATDKKRDANCFKVTSDT